MTGTRARRAQLAALVALGFAAAWGCGSRLGTLRSPINGLSLDLPRRPATYSFLLAGHLYGSQNESVYPAASVLANLERFNGRDVRFVILLGDMLRDPSPISIAAFDRSFAAQVRRPIFNTIGNHDDDGGGLYRQRFGAPAYYAFRHASEYFIILDGERDNGDIRGEQLAFLHREIATVRESPEVANLFVLCHRLVWMIGNPPLNAVIPQVNGPESHPKEAVTFTTEILPELRKLQEKHVFLIGGDVGGAWSLPLFFERDREGNVTYIATGIGDTIDDAILSVSVVEGEVSFAPISLTGAGLLAPGAAGAAPRLETFGVAYWLSHARAKR